MLSVFHSPRLEDLAAHLCESIRVRRRGAPLSILQPVQVVVGHLGMARWLEQHFAKQLGIFANVQFKLLGEWLEQLRLNSHGHASPAAAAPNRYTIEAMAWAINQILSNQRDFAPVVPSAAFFEALGEQNPREQFAFAQRMARLFSDYLIYRREWAQEFLNPATQPQRRAQQTLHSRDWQAALFRAVVAQLGPQHRAQRMTELLELGQQEPVIQGWEAALAGGDADILFGLNHLPADVLALLHQRCAQHEIAVYFPNPCLEYWGDLVRERFLRQRRLSADLFGASTNGDGGDFAHFDVGHPLLSSLGAHGQAYFAELAYLSDTFIEVPSAIGPLSPAMSAKPTILAALQHGITRLVPDYAPSSLSADASVRTICCTSALSELEHVRDVIVQALHDDPQLALEEVAIIAPDLARYAPLLPAVFGTLPALAPAVSVSARGPALRFSLMDFDDAPGAHPHHSRAARDPTDDAQAMQSHILQLVMNAASSDWSAPALLALLKLPLVAAHFALDAQALARAEILVQRARIALGLSDRHLQQRSAYHAPPGVSAAATATATPTLHTWSAGLDRLLFGYLHGNGDLDGEGGMRLQPGAAIPWPVAQMGPGDAEILTALLTITRQLSAAVQANLRPRSVPDWLRWLDLQVLSLTGTSVSTHPALRALAHSAELANAFAPVALAAAAGAFAQQQTQHTRRIAPQPGAICVCSLVPMRALPFKLVCMVGLNDGEFPKTPPPDALNLMQLAGARRAGDRSAVAEDRYLFLEAIMAARQRLVLSFHAAPGAAKAPEARPAAILQELLAHLDRQFAPRIASRPWAACAVVPPQPVAEPWAQPWAFAVEPNAARRVVTTRARMPEQAPTEASTLLFSELLRFWQRPLDHYVQQRLQLALPRAAFSELDEPLDFTLPAIERLETRLLRQALVQGELPSTAPQWLSASGLLPSGALGVRSFEAMRESIRPSWLAARRQYPELRPAHAAARLDVRMSGRKAFGSDSPASVRLCGSVAQLDLATCTLVHVSAKAPHGAQKLALMLQLLALRAQQDADEQSAPAPRWRAVMLGPNPQLLPLLDAPGFAAEQLLQLAQLRHAWLYGAADGEPGCGLPWFWPKLSALCAGLTPDAAQTVVQTAQTYELQSSDRRHTAFDLLSAGGSLASASPAGLRFFAPQSAEFKQFLQLSNFVFAPLSGSTGGELASDCAASAAERVVQAPATTSGYLHRVI